MLRSMYRLAFIASVLALAVGHCLAAGGPFDVPATAEGEQLLHKRLGFAPGAKVSYLDAEGKPLEFAEFLAQLSKQSMSMGKNKEDNSIQLRIMNRAAADERAAEFQKRMAALKVKAGQPLPDFSLKGLDGKSYDNASLAGKYSVISFFFEACAPCVAEVPSLNKFRDLHPELNLVAVTYDDQAKAQRFQDRYKLNWPVLIESRSFNQSVGIGVYPSFVVLDPQGRFLGYRVMGQIPSDEEAAGRAEHKALAAWVKQLVSQDAKDKGG